MEETQIHQRIFFVDDLKDLYEILLRETEKPRYARKKRRHEKEHAVLVQSFQPAFPDKPPDICFGVTFLDDVVIPGTFFTRKVKGLSSSESHRQFPDLLFEEWDAATIRDFYSFLRAGTKNGSKSDKALLRN